MSKRRGLLPARIGVVSGALAGLALTLPFAAAFQVAYDPGGSSGLVPEGLTPWLFEHGLLGDDSEAVYDRYGVAYLVAVGLVTSALSVLARPIREGKRVIVIGLVVLCVGIFGDYVVPNDVVGGVGFLLEAVGFLVVAAGVGLVVHRHAGAVVGVGAALATLASMVAGGALTGHIPGGPGLTVMLGALVFALRADVSSDGAYPDLPTAPD